MWSLAYCFKAVFIYQLGEFTTHTFQKYNFLSYDTFWNIHLGHHSVKKSYFPCVWITICPQKLLSTIAFPLFEKTNFLPSCCLWLDLLFCFLFLKILPSTGQLNQSFRNIIFYPFLFPGSPSPLILLKHLSSLFSQPKHSCWPGSAHSTM